MPQLTNPSQRLQSALRALLQRHHHHRRRAIDNAARVPRRHRPALAKRRLQLRQPFHRSLRTPVIIFGQRLSRRLALVIAQRHRHQLFLNASFFISRIRPLLRTQRKFILHLARNALLRTIKLCGIRHIRPAISIEQRHHQRIFQLSARRQSKSVAPANHKRSLRHRLHPARQHNLRLVGLDHLRRLHNRLHPRPAQPVHRQRRSLNRQPRPQSHVPRAIQRVARSLLRIAKHGMIEFLGVDPGAFDRALRRDRRPIPAQ